MSWRQLTGKTTVITGAGGGIGQALALRYAAAGFAAICALAIDCRPTRIRWAARFWQNCNRSAWQITSQPAL